MRLSLRLAGVLVLLVGAAACDRAGLPSPSSPAYTETVAAFYRGVAAAQVGETGLATVAFQRVTELAPQEPAGWANLGLIALQRRELDPAAERLERARQLAPDHGDIHLLSALVERDRGRLDSATALLRRAVALDSRNLRALYLLAQIVEQEDRPAGTAEAQQLIGRILAAQPDNLAAQLELARVAAKLRDAATLRQVLDGIEQRAEARSFPAAAELRAVRAAADAREFARAATQVAFLQTALQVLPRFRDDQAALATTPSRIEMLLTRFARMANPTPRPANPDTSIRFAAESLAVGRAPIAWVRALWLGDELSVALVAANPDTVWISTGRDQLDALVAAGGVTTIAPLDYDYDFRIDLAVAGRGGLRLLRQDGVGSFTDVTTEALPSAVARAPYVGAWAADLDMEGDLDLVLAGDEGPPVVLRNRGDGRFERAAGFDSVTRVRDFVWADLDADGDPDATLLDAEGELHVFSNQRYRVPQFEKRPSPAAVGHVTAIAAADLDRDATLDLIALDAGGAVHRLAFGADGWVTQLLGRWRAFPETAAATRLLVADLDNNGEIDIVASAPHGSQAWLSTPAGLRALPPMDERVTAIADISGDGRLDLIAVSRDGDSRLLVNQGTLDYYSATIRPRAAQITGDRRINSFGVGGEVEIRAGLLYSKQPIHGPAVHFGLGEQPQVDVARIIWPNGTVQAEFNLAATNETILTRQRLKGSCPWVFAYDGTEMRFVTDFLWRSGLGIRINAQGEAAVIHSQDWIKIRGDQLAPRDGYYDVRITAELWETHFFDHVALMVVDHPADTEVFVDERFTLPAPPLAVHAMRPLRPVPGAWDHRGRDVTELVGARDERYLDTFELGPYQGIAQEHYVELALDDTARTDGPLWLVASGWVYPTDASINVAFSQAEHRPPHGLQLEVPDGEGGWTIVERDLGFPSGKTKTILIDLRSAFRPGTPRRVRLRTNMEIYWDQIAWTTGEPEAPITTQRLLPASAELRYRGFSRVRQASRAAPELPDYARIASAVPLWRDLAGFHTRFGDVRPLTEAVDDRYTIMNAGDELVLRFPAPPPPRDGWTRDFVLIGDGWVKDGDYNTGFSTTVLPLPYHGLSDYARPPGRLQDDPAYRRHPEDWSLFHTRYVTPRGFHRALVPQPGQ